MALKAPVKEHQRQTTVVFDPDQAEKREYNVTATRKKRVAAYARVSTEQDAQQNSYEAQISFYTDYIKSRPDWEFAGVYADEGLSGTSYKKREGFNRMVDDAENGKIDLILTKSISRFARNTVDSLTITRKLKAAGVEVYFEKENISSMDAQAELIFTIMSSVAQEESRSISENVRWGHQRSMEAGKVSLAWSNFLGYEKGPDGLPHIVEEQAKIVRKIYRLFLEGKSINMIAEQLTQEGYKTPMNADHWYPTTVRSILSNEKYKGDARLQKTYTVDFLTKEVRVNNGERKQWYIHDSHDAIVSPETFELAQKELRRRTGRHGRFYDSPFTGKIICGECGAYYGHRVWDSNNQYRKNIWLCNDKYKNGTKCPTPRIMDAEIMQTFLIAVNRLPKDRAAYCDEYERKFLPLIGDTADLEKELAILTEELNDQIAQIERLVLENAQKAQDQAVYTQKFDALSKSIEQKKALIHSIEQQISEAMVKKENARIYLEGLRNTESGSLLTKFGIRLWHALVEYAKVMPDKTIIFHFRNGNEETVRLEEAH